MKRIKRIISLVLGIFLILGFSPAMAADTSLVGATASLQAALPTTLNVGDEFTVQFKLNNVTDFYGGSLELVYNKSVATVSSITAGDIFNSKPSNLVLEPINKYDNTKGTLQYVRMLSTNTAGVTGSGTLVSVKFKIVGAGTFKLYYTRDSKATLSLAGNNCRVILSDSNAQPITFTSTNVSRTISAAPTVLQPGKYEETNAGLKYTGTWSNLTSASCSGGAGKFSGTTGNNVAFTFNGTGFKWYGYASSNKGIAKVTVDGVAQNVDTYNSTAAYQKLLLDKQGLTAGNHTVKIEVTGLKNAKSTGTVIFIDAIEVVSAPPALEPGLHEETDANIKYTGTWTKHTDARDSGGTGKFSGTKNNSFEFNFNGTGFKWIGYANTSRGIATVTVDGVSQNVDTYSATSVFKKVMFEKVGLTNGNHTVKVTVTGTKRTGAASALIFIDAIEVVNQPVLSAGTYEESNAGIKFTGTWTNQTDARNSGGKAKFSGTAGNSFEFVFSGTGFKWTGYANTSRGIATVIIDGVSQDVDTYSATSVFKKVMFQKTGMTNGTHTVKIVVTGTKRAGAAAAYIHLDTIQVLP